MPALGRDGWKGWMSRLSFLNIELRLVKPHCVAASEVHRMMTRTLDTTREAVSVGEMEIGRKEDPVIAS